MLDIKTAIAEQVEQGFDEVITNKLKLLDVENTLPAELTQAQLAKMFGISIDYLTARFLRHKDFPRIKPKEGTRTEKYPRDAVRDWYRLNWERTTFV